MTRNAWIFFVAAMLATFGETSFGQRTPNWRVYKVADGLPELPCLSVTVSPQGRIVTRHFINFASELDGYSISTTPVPEGSRRIYQSPGGQFWTVKPGGLEEFKDGAWFTHPLPRLISQAYSAPSGESIPLCPVRIGLVICLLRDQLLEFNSASTISPQGTILRKVEQTRLKTFSGMTMARDGGLWISGERGLARVPGPLRNVRPDTEWQEYLPPQSLPIENFEEPHEDLTGGVSVVAESADTHEKMIAYFDGQRWSAWSAGNQKMRHAWRGPDGSWWAATGSALFHADAANSDLIENEEIAARQYHDVALEPSGAFWLATSDGLFRFASLSWRKPIWLGKNATPVHCLSSDSQGRVWFVSGAALHLIQADRVQEFRFPGHANILSIAHRLFPLKNGDLVLEAEEQLFQFQAATEQLTALRGNNATDRLKALGLMRDGRLCLQNLAAAGATQIAFEAFDGTSFQHLPCPGPDPALGADISSFFEAQNGDLWLGAENGTACYHEKKWKIFAPTDKSAPEAPVGFAELSDNKIWCGSADKIWQFDGRDWSEVRRGFDRINSLLRSHRDNSIWVASNAGIHRFYDGAWVENSIEEGLPSMAIRNLSEDQNGRLWAGTTFGLSVYDPEADRDPPQTQIYPLSDNEKNIPESGAITLSFSGQDKWKFTARDRLLYSYRLDDRDWSPFQESGRATFNDLTAGKHSFWVRAMDRNCNIDTKPPRVEFAVVLPWYKETRLVAISLAGGALALFFAGLAFNRHRQLARSYIEVEQKVAGRTHELEVASRELLHSQKMTALGTLAAGIAHDFNNILSIIKGSAQIIEENLDNPQKVSTRVDRIKTVVEQGSAIVKAMLGFSRASDLQGGPCDVNGVVEDTIKLLGDRFLREVQVTFQPTPALPVLPCPKDLIQQILLNFIFNAAESMDGHKQIVISTHCVEQSPHNPVLHPAPSSTYVTIVVRDSGGGIAPENMARIFEPFFTTKALSARRGTGLGLSMVYELARKLDAGLAVESVLNKGSTFTLILPVQESLPKSENPKANAETN